MKDNKTAVNLKNIGYTLRIYIFFTPFQDKKKIFPSHAKTQEFLESVNICRGNDDDEERGGVKKKRRDLYTKICGNLRFFPRFR